MHAPRFFGIVPAAGQSRRMGSPKLLLPWRGSTVIQSVLDAWTESSVDRTCVVVRRSDGELAEYCQRAGVDLIQPADDPEDMKASVQLAIRHIESAYVADQRDGWLIAPADLPGLSADAIDAVLRQRDPNHLCISVPQFEDRRGHPVLFPWRFAEQVFRLEANEGLNAIVSRETVHEIRLAGRAVTDIDTPEQYRRSLERH